MRYKWNKELETGNKIIDLQHKELFDVLNKLVAAKERKEGAKELDKAIKFLADYVVRHFADEEKMQEEHGYPDMLSHKFYHNNFKKTVTHLIHELEVQGYNDELTEDTIRIMAEWLVHHIKSDDLEFAKYIRANPEKK